MKNNADFHPSMKATELKEFLVKTIKSVSFYMKIMQKKWRKN